MIGARDDVLVRVDMADRAYDVRIGANLMSRAGTCLESLIERRRLVIVTDQTVAALPHLAALSAALGLEASDAIVLPPGEGTKSFDGLERLCDAVLARELDRGDALIALGGGVIGDLVGFAAAILKRGIDFIQVPTTLLAQVDSSVGGKTAINAAAGKNLIGAFHQPIAVLADVAALDTLPARDLAAGYAEIVKIALALDHDFLDWLERHGAGVVSTGQAGARIEAVRRAVALKAAVVARDEREAGERALLNLGHTFGHAFEAEAGYGSGLRHGEAVGVGLVMACDYAERLGRDVGGLGDRARRLLAGASLPIRPSALDGAPFEPERVLARMRNDKKTKAGVLRLVLPLAAGAADVIVEDDESRLLAFLDDQLKG